MKYKDLYKAIANLKKNPTLVFGHTQLSTEKSQEFHADIDNILCSLKVAHSKLKAPIDENSPTNAGSIINGMIQATIKELRKQFLEPSRKRFALKRTYSSHDLTVNIIHPVTPLSAFQKTNKLRRIDSASIAPLRSIRLEFMCGIKAKPSPISSAKDLPQVRERVQRDITFLQRAQPIFQALNANSKKEHSNTSRRFGQNLR